MRIKILFLVLTVGLYYCTPPKYITQKQSEILKLDLDNSITNFIPLADDELIRSKVLDSSYNLIMNKKLSRLDRYLTSLESSGIVSSDLYLSKTLLCISQNKYMDAIHSLNKIGDSDFTFLKQLLSIDLTYEAAKINGATDYNGFLKNYQALIDSYPDNTSLKKIIAIRLRYLRYNY
jgi:hypothetical protein